MRIEALPTPRNHSSGSRLRFLLPSPSTLFTNCRSRVCWCTGVHIRGWDNGLLSPPSSVSSPPTPARSIAALDIVPSSSRSSRSLGRLFFLNPSAFIVPPFLELLLCLDINEVAFADSFCSDHLLGGLKRLNVCHAEILIHERGGRDGTGHVADGLDLD